MKSTFYSLDTTKSVRIDYLSGTLGLIKNTGSHKPLETYLFSVQVGLWKFLLCDAHDVIKLGTVKLVPFSFTLPVTLLIIGYDVLPLRQSLKKQVTE